MARKDKLGSNPAEAARKAARQKELKRNKAARAQTREFGLVKKDLRPLEEQLGAIERRGGDGKALRIEIEEIRRAKADYLKKHPEHRKHIYPSATTSMPNMQGQQAQQGPASGQLADFFRPDGKSNHPERSIYYDPIFNPWGNPPPGLPYREKPPHEWPSGSGFAHPPTASSAVSVDDEDSDDIDDIVMPAGPPPQLAPSSIRDGNDDDDGDDDGIVMPAGPPPLQNVTSASPELPEPPPAEGYTGPLPAFYNGLTEGFPPAPPVIFGPPPTTGTDIPPGSALPRGFAATHAPPRIAPRSRPPPHAPRGPTVQAAAQTIGPTRPPGATTTSGGATITSAPVLRDFKREATAFLPASVRKQKAIEQRRAKVAGLGSRTIRANPVTADDDVGVFERSSAHEAQPQTAPSAQISNDRPTDAQSIESLEEERIDPAKLHNPRIGPAATSHWQQQPYGTVTQSGSAAAGGLLAYYSDSDDEDSDTDGAGDQKQACRAIDALAPQGRVDLVETLSKVP